jgi:hypothetical protein
MKKLIAPLTALALGFASISTFAVDTPARDGVTVAKKHHRAVKKHHSNTPVNKHRRAAAVR